MSPHSRDTKIMLVADGFGHGGIQQAYRVLLKEYTKSCSWVNLLIIQSSNQDLYLDQMENFSIFKLGGKGLLDFRNYLRFYLKIRQSKSNIIVASMYRSQIWSALAKNKKSKLIWVEHNTYHQRTTMQWILMKLLSSKVDKIVGVSTEVSDLTRSKLLKDVVTIPNPITLAVRNDLSSARPDDFAFIGRMTHQKNPELMLRSFCHFLLTNNLNSRLHIIGDGELLESMIKLSDELGIVNSCSFYGWVELEEIGNILSRVRTLVSTSKIEGMGIVRVEALASGCCVVTTNTGGTLLFQELEESGFFVTPPTMEDISQAMLNSLDSRYWSQRRMNQRIDFVERFEARYIADRLIS